MSTPTEGPFSYTNGSTLCVELVVSVGRATISDVNPMRPSPTSLDLFAGAGGLSEGLRQSGFSPIYANEIVPNHARTYQHNHPETIVDARDIRSVNPNLIREQLQLGVGELDLLAGGPPCQGFSINAPVRSGADGRNHLFRDYLRFVEEFRPRVALIENVPGLVSFDKGGTLQAILDSLGLLGYTAAVHVLYAPDYGVPQTRWRTIIIGSRDGGDIESFFPTPEYRAPRRVNFTSTFQGRSLVTRDFSSATKRFTTVKDAIGDLPRLANGESGEPLKAYLTAPGGEFQAGLREGSPGIANHEAGRLSSVNLERMSHIPPGGNWTDIPFDLLPAGMQRARRTDHTKRYGRADPDGLSSTILTKCDPHWGAYFHYDQDRTFTVREAARIQTFPDAFVFTGPKVDQYEQVGNAVPPMLGRAVGRSILTGLELQVESATARMSA